MSWVEAELREQPVALERFLTAESTHAPGIVRALLRADVRYLLIVSRGSSSNVARYMQYLFGTVNRLPVAFATPSLYTVYDAPPVLGPAAVIGISQSGASPDVVAVLANARKQNRPTLAITNDPKSPLALASDCVLQLHAGEERAVAATKTYLNSIAAVALLSTAGDPQRLGDLLAMPERVGEQLKIRELSGAQFEAFSSADLLHGPIAALKSGRPAIVIAPAGRTLLSMGIALEKVRERGAEVIAISDDEEFLTQSETALPLVRGVPEWLTPLLTVVPGQVAAVRLATLRDANVDSPVGLTKITLTH